jgi:hypothetical protein
LKIYISTYEKLYKKQNKGVYFLGGCQWLKDLHLQKRGSHGCIHMVVGFTTTYAIGAYDH